MEKLVIVGAANPEVVRLVRAINAVEPRFDLLGFVDDKPDLAGANYQGLPVLGPVEWLRAHRDEVVVVSAVAKTTEIRRKVHARLASMGVNYMSLVHPSVDVSDVVVGQDVLIYEGSVVSPNVTISDHAVLSVRSTVAHDSEIGEYSFLAPGCVLNGKVTLGEGVFVGSGAVVIPFMKAGAWSTIGAGAVVVRDVPAGATVFGNPAEVIFQRELSGEAA